MSAFVLFCQIAHSDVFHSVFSYTKDFTIINYCHFLVGFVWFILHHKLTYYSLGTHGWISYILICIVFCLYFIILIVALQRFHIYHLEKLDLSKVTNLGAGRGLSIFNLLA